MLRCYRDRWRGARSVRGKGYDETMLSGVTGAFSDDIAIDLGTANTLVLVLGRGIIIDEPSMVAIRARNGTREVMIGGGYMSYSSGINKDRVVAMTEATLDDQSRAPNGYELHEIAPAKDLPPGEYAVVLYNSEVKVAGWFVSGRDSYFDFGIDG